MIAIGLWMATSVGLKVCLTRIGNHSVAYCAPNSVIVLLLWLYLTPIAILAGADISAQRERDACVPPLCGFWAARKTLSGGKHSP